VSVLCSECPRELTRDQVRRMGVTCSKACAAARCRRLGRRLEAYRRRRAAVRGELQVAGLSGPVLERVVEIVLDWNDEGYGRGYDVREHRERRLRRAS
jgi:hypothetical protein